MVDRSEFARSFLDAGEAYERYRPGFPVAAVAYIVPRPVDAILDLGAGTGKLTRLLLERAREVIAVDPSEQMLEQLQRISPTVTASVGTAERIPLLDASVDLVTVAQAFHWFDRDPACAEIGRVLRSDGSLALLWNVPDAHCAWDIACGRLAHPEQEGELPNQSSPPAATPLRGFRATGSTWIPWTEQVSRTDYLARWGTVSSMMIADDRERGRRLSAMTAVLDADPETAGLDVLHLRHMTEAITYRVAASADS